MKNLIRILILFYISAAAHSVLAQTTAFTYQGKLTDTGTPQANYQMQFRLFDALSGGNQIGDTIEVAAVPVSQGVFSVLLDFGANVFTTGADRFLEIGVRRGTGENYTVLNPRQRIAASPFSIRTLSAAQADLALDANKLGGINAGEYLTDLSLGNTVIRNQTTQQTANFNISGSGFFGGSVGIGTTNPATKFSVLSDFYGISHTDGTRTVSTYLNSQGGWIGTTTNHPFHFFTNNGTPQMTVAPTGNVGIGTTAPAERLDVTGGFTGSVRALGSGAGHFIAQTTGGTNSWARFYMRSPNRSWFIGTSQNFNGDQFYIADETGGQTRMTIQPNVGLIAFTGNVSNNLSSYGLPKAMVFVLANGTISRCYNGVTGSTSGNCGFSVTGIAGTYAINFGFSVAGRFFSVNTHGSDGTETSAKILAVESDGRLSLKTFFTNTGDLVVSDFFLIVY